MLICPHLRQITKKVHKLSVRTKGSAKEGGVKLLDITEQPMGYQVILHMIVLNNLRPLSIQHCYRNHPSMC